MSPDAGPMLALAPALARLQRLSRRHLLSGAGAAGWLVACRGPAPPPARERPAPAAPAHLLGDDARAVLDAVTSRILPSDDGPGAREARVVDFIEAQLATPFLRAIAPAIALTAQLLDREARARHRVGFTTLAGDRQDALLDALAHGRLSAPGFPQRPAFQALHALTLEGFLADPVHGGNRDMIGWKAIGFDEPALRPGRPGGHHHDAGRGG
jgi:gluconate 2-dehydrogenase gamma chain